MVDSKLLEYFLIITYVIKKPGLSKKPGLIIISIDKIIAELFIYFSP